MLILEYSTERSSNLSKVTQVKWNSQQFSAALQSQAAWDLLVSVWKSVLAFCILPNSHLSNTL